MEMRKEETVTADSFDVELSDEAFEENDTCLLYTSPSPRDVP